MNTTGYVYKLIDTPFGKLKLVASQKGLAAVLWEKDDPRRVRLGPLKPGSNNKFIDQAEGQLKAYFSGKLKKFTVPLDFKGTDFQKSVWKTMSEIPYGETATYGGIAMALASGARAVGTACGRNPIPIIVPCHRVLGSGSSEGGFSGGQGLPTKRKLLALEGVVLL
jgi:methylated-DNA-[protein]-cysteine S-methyltransferase